MRTITVLALTLLAAGERGDLWNPGTAMNTSDRIIFKRSYSCMLPGESLE